MARIPVIKATNLAKEFELGKITVKALQSVNLEIYSGEFIIFFGPSGCGKSTLMSMIAGLQPPSSGSIEIRGENLSKMDEEELATHRRNKIGMVFQSFNLISTMNVIENIALPLTFAKIDRKRRMARAENLLDVVGMSEYKKHTPSELSGGQQQRIAIARSLVSNPWIMLADEPTGNLDSKSANEVMRLLISLNRKSKRTVVLITHNPDYLEYADRIFYLRDGKVIDVKVNAKVKNIEEVASVGKIKDDLKPGDLEDQAKKIVSEIKPDDNNKEENNTEENKKDNIDKNQEDVKKNNDDKNDNIKSEENNPVDSPAINSEDDDGEETEKSPTTKKGTGLKPMKLGGKK